MLVVCASTHSGAAYAWSYSALLDALHDPVLDTREEAVMWINAHGSSNQPDESPDDLLEELWQRFKQTHQANVINAIGKLGPVSIGLGPRIEELLSDKDPSLRTAAVNTLMAMGKEATSYQAAIDALIVDPDPDVREAAKHALGIREPPDPEVVPGVAERVPDLSEVDLRIELLEKGESLDVVSRLNEHSGVTPQQAARIARQLNNPRMDVRITAAEVLSGIGPVGERFAPQVAGLLNDSYGEVRVAAATDLAGMHEAGARQAPAVAKALRFQDSATRLAALDALGHMSSVEKFRDSIEKLLGATDPEVKVTARELLDRADNEEKVAVGDSAIQASSAVARRRQAVSDASPRPSARPESQSEPAVPPQVRSVRPTLHERLACLEASLTEQHNLAKLRLGCYLLGPLSSDEATVFEWVNDREAGIFPNPRKISGKTAVELLTTFNKLWPDINIPVDPDTPTNDNVKMPALRTYVARVVQKVASAQAGEFGVTTYPLLAKLATRLDNANFDSEAASIKSIYQNTPSFYLWNVVRGLPWLFLGGLAIFCYVFYRARRSSRAFKILADDSLWKFFSYYPMRLVAHVRWAQLWIADLYYHNRRQSTLKAHNVPYLAVRLASKSGAVRQSDAVCHPTMQGRRVWIQGNSGMGKTALFNHLLKMQYLTSATSFGAFRKQGCVLVAFSARTYGDGGSDAADESWVFNGIKGTLAREGMSFENDRLLRDVVRSGSLGVAVDGLNEAGRTNSLTTFVSHYPETPILVTSQDTPPEDFQAWYLPADLHALTDDLLDLYLGEPHSNQAKRAITESGLRAHLRSGYDVRLIVDLISRSDVPIQVPSRLGEMYELAVETSRPPALSDSLWKDRRMHLEHAAWELMSQNKRNLQPSDALPPSILREMSRESLGGNERLRILRPLAESFEFVHDQMRAYLAARWFVRPEFSTVALGKMLSTADVVMSIGDDARSFSRFVCELLDNDRLNSLKVHVDGLEDWGILRVMVGQEVHSRMQATSSSVDVPRT
ncbi:HEAT repeat domain-containing protein [Paraburkholderia sp. C35]|uniref:HEAT repeat domain-containing protein n=1 Tax=Paraburkholderia sp. C35 TaxID=2126993 RepID=UPI0013A5A8FD|nr:HEAT repeat domain-containing protein [Paraburkholderia sp. C35]